MGGGLMQLVAYGAQDVYLTGNPQITFFKVVYRRHTNFSMEVIEHTLNGNPDFGRRSSVTITRNGDLITRMYLRVELDSIISSDGFGSIGWVRRLGHALINSVELEIGGSRIDKHYGTWLDIWYELTHSTEQERGYLKMIGDVDILTRLDGPVDPGEAMKKPYTLYVPLQFWFCRNVGLALPLIALQYHEVRLHFEFTQSERLIVRSTDLATSTTIRMRDASLLVDYIYLDSAERRRFAQVGHEYLIEQLQFTGEESANQTSVKVKLGFNHPTKEIIFAIRNGNYFSSSSKGKAFLGYSNTEDWFDALQAAADNIATGMVAVDTQAPNDFDYVQVGTVPWTNGVYAVDLDGIELEVDVTFIAQDGQTPQLFAYIRRDVFVNGNINLGDNIFAISVFVTQDGDAVNGFEYPVVSFATFHEVNINHLSIPVELWTDNRENTDPTFGNPLDVCVYQWHNYGVLIDGTWNPVDKALLQLNGHDRFDVRDGPYFNYVQPYQHHTRTPSDGINVYSFAVHPEQHQPSGTANLSRIDNTQLNIFFVNDTILEFGNPLRLQFLNTDTKLYIYALSYNVLRIMSGMGGVAYSN